ncbi:MAG: translocation/assembly module TamB domain-containing protein [Acidithiobacillus sp.]
MIRIRHGIMVGVLLVLISLATILVWLLTTNNGARWVLAQVPNLRVEQVKGSLAGEMQLSGISWHSANIRIRAQSLQWQLHPAHLLKGEVDLADLRLYQSDLHLPVPSDRPSAIHLRWPALPLWTRLIDLKLSPVTFMGLRIWQGTQESFILSQATFSELTWQHGNLRIKSLSAQMPQGRLQLTADLRMGARGLQSLGVWKQGSAANPLTVKWETHWHGISAQTFGGPFSIQVKESKQLTALIGMAQISTQQILLQSLQFSNPALQKPAQGHWRIDLPNNTAGNYRISGGFEQILAKALPDALPIGALALSLNLQGNIQHYQGQLALRGDPQFGGIQGSLNGDRQKLQYHYAGKLLGADLLPSTLAARWQPQLTVTGQIRIRNLKTQHIMAQVPGNISGDLSVSATQISRVVTGDVRLQLLPSQLYRQTLQGEALIHFAGSQWNLQRAQFLGPGVNLSAQGNLRQRLHFVLNVAQWRGLFPGAQGKSQIEGWVARPEAQWTGEIQGTGQGLAYHGVRINTLKIQGKLRTTKALQATIHAKGLAYAGHRVNLQVRAQGPLTRFTLGLDAQWPQSRLSVMGLVSHQANAWGLQVDKTTLASIPLGNWQLLHPTTLQWVNGAASLSKMTFADAHAARITAQGRYNSGTNQAVLGLDVQSLPLDFLTQTKDATLRGFLNAHLQAQCHGICQAEGHWDFQKTQLQWRQEGTPHTLSLQRFTGQLRWLPKDLSLAADLSLANDWGNAQVALHSPATLALPWRWDANIPLQGVIKAHVGAPLFAALPVGSLRIRPQGQGTIDAQVLGTWAHPRWTGTGQLQGLGFFVPQAGLDIHDVGARLVGDGKEIQISQLVAISGSGQISGTGIVQFQQANDFTLHLTGKNFTALNLPQVQAAVSPDLSISGNKKNINVQGNIHTDRLRILGTDFSGPRPSGDVVFVKNEHKSSGPALDVNLHVTLGDDARVIISGLRARLVGDLAVEMHDGQSPQVNGTLRMVDGRYAIYGHTLDFERGSILFHGAANQANLDVLAIRTIKSSSSFAVDNTPVQAGVQVTGTLQTPRVALYSKPSMSQTDILSYLVLGTPSSGLTSQNALLSAAAGTLFSASRAALFGNSLNSSGIDVGVSSEGNSGLAGAMVTMGHYLTPDLYLSVGQSVLGSGTVARLRYRISRHIEIQTESGTQNGANIFYRIDF